MVKIGRHTYHAPNLSLRTWRPEELITIGSFCSIAQDVVIQCGGRHRSDFASTFPFEQIMLQATDRDRIYKTTRPTVIGNDVWICDRATITGGVRIGHGAIIGAGAVVFGKVPPYAVVAGNPAQIVSYRFGQDTIKRLLDLSWWDWSDETITQNVEWFYRPAQEFLEHFSGGTQ